ncbi:hypothetical protein Isop_3424 [Isosphaera pallida ATCC 43644]|uniref:Protein tyrosine/serine phosphatase n=1 Tax=Isosphaera pallida (strain ATCC 43644 / DSM 9630 / IS1B) TaxID=575540 RepID=E8R6T0_ISOPI|nr:tyrosine-protein phosphatase [Isosphaera pallida]ADV63982.1 hypothetical protein Isop_3424 [Isosphaera pallida ATCC 43644]
MTLQKRVRNGLDIRGHHRTTTRPRPGWRVWAGRLMLLAGLAVAGFVGWRVAIGNFAVIEPGELYRSAQLSAAQLDRVIADHGIRAVLNLRGHNPDEPWYRNEVATTLKRGATQIDVAMSSCDWASRAQMNEIVRILETAPRPLLIHCWHGSERTGLVSALAILLRPGSTLEEAERQFSWRYLYVPFGDGVTTYAHLKQYKHWLERTRRPHTPETLKDWVGNHFRPGFPSREHWPYDPYPLSVITRVEPSSEARTAVNSESPPRWR